MCLNHDKIQRFEYNSSSTPLDDNKSCIFVTMKWYFERISSKAIISVQFENYIFVKKKVTISKKNVNTWKKCSDIKFYWIAFGFLQLIEKQNSLELMVYQFNNTIVSTSTVTEKYLI